MHPAKRIFLALLAFALTLYSLDCAAARTADVPIVRFRATSHL